MHSLVRVVLAAPFLMLAGAHSASGPTRNDQPRAWGNGVVSDTGSRSAIDSTLADATFDSAWQIVGTSLQDRRVTRGDWLAVGRELRPRAARAATDTALRDVITEMLARI